MTLGLAGKIAIFVAFKQNKASVCSPINKYGRNFWLGVVDTDRLETHENLRSLTLSYEDQVS